MMASHSRCNCALFRGILASTWLDDGARVDQPTQRQRDLNSKARTRRARQALREFLGNVGRREHGVALTKQRDDVLSNRRLAASTMRWRALASACFTNARFTKARFAASLLACVHDRRRNPPGCGDGLCGQTTKRRDLRVHRCKRSPQARRLMLELGELGLASAQLCRQRCRRERCEGRNLIW